MARISQAPKAPSSAPTNVNPGIVPSKVPGSSNLTNHGGFYNWIGYDPTLEQDKREGKFHEPQLQDGWRSFTTWTHNVDGNRSAQYILRQIYAFPSTLIGLLRLPAYMFIGMFIRYTIQALWLGIHYYALIPGSIMALTIIISYLVVTGLFRVREMILPASLKLVLVGMGCLL